MQVYQPHRWGLDMAELPGTPDSALAGVAILIVDDNEDTADALGLLLQQYGCDVRIALDGHLALEVVKEFRPALMLLDITMPGIDGYSVCQTIRATYGKDIYVVAVTGWAKDEDRQKALASGFDDHVAKPVPMERLMQVVERAIDRRSSKLPPG
jgi:CheY-like chemotaxis protein